MFNRICQLGIVPEEIFQLLGETKYNAIACVEDPILFTSWLIT